MYQGPTHKLNSSRFISVPRNNRTYIPKYPSRTLADDNLKGYESSKAASFIQEDLTAPQRIELPVYFNTPRRYSVAKSRFTARATSSQSRQSPLDLERRTTVTKRLHDYRMLAFACKRAGKSRDEGRAHYSMGVLYDNLCQFPSAIKCYEDFLQVCRSIGDTHGEALAYNCLGVDFHKLAESSPANVDCWQRAIEYHILHKDIADVPGKFLAHVNLGLVYSKTDDENRASINHQFALRYAIQMSSAAGQSLALGNLSQIGHKKLKGDNERLKMFAERYLELNNELKNKKAEGNALEQLGSIHLISGDFEASSKNYFRAMRLAGQNGYKELESTAKCGFGVASANLHMDNHIQGILMQLHRK